PRPRGSWYLQAVHEHSLAPLAAGAGPGARSASCVDDQFGRVTTRRRIGVNHLDSHRVSLVRPRTSPTVTKRRPLRSPALRIESRAATVLDGSAMRSCRMMITPGAKFLVTSHRI